MGHAYGIKKRPGDFIIDLLQLKTPNLFLSSQTETGSSGETVAENFTRFLKKYINQYNLRSEITNRIKEIEKMCSKRCPDHGILLLDNSQCASFSKLKLHDINL